MNGDLRFHYERREFVYRFYELLGLEAVPSFCLYVFTRDLIEHKSPKIPVVLFMLLFLGLIVGKGYTWLIESIFRPRNESITVENLDLIRYQPWKKSSKSIGFPISTISEIRYYPNRKGTGQRWVIRTDDAEISVYPGLVNLDAFWRVLGESKKLRVPLPSHLEPRKITLQDLLPRR